MSGQTGVYVKDEQYGWLPAKVLSSEDATTVTVEVTMPCKHYDGRHSKEERKIDLKDYDDGTLPMQNVDESGNIIVVPDMCDLPSLHEAAILYNLKSRHESSSPYTRVGDIVIAMNPFEVSSFAVLWMMVSIA